jgi:hypothetical protein
MKISKLGALVCAAWVGLSLCARAQVRSLETPRTKTSDVVHVPLLVHMTHENGQAVASEGFVSAQLRRANEIFAPYGVLFDLVDVLPSRAAPHMETRADRSALAAWARDGVVDCFVVASLRDVDEPGRIRRGVHWHSESTPGTHYVILSAISEPDVLAHELGHYLGNPRHSDVAGNLMSYLRGEGLPVLDAAQRERVRRALRAYRKSGELKLK